MVAIQVGALGIGDLLDTLRTGEWQVPKFQREFVWTSADVEALIGSIITARPIGMVTLWAQPKDSGLSLENISLPDSNGQAYFSKEGSKPDSTFAILDGRQRCTAIAMAFGGLAPGDGRMRHAGRYFLSLLPEDDATPIKYKKTADIEKDNLGSVAGALQRGYVPLEVEEDKKLFDAWISLAQKIHDPAIYAGSPPAKEVLEQRNEMLLKCSRAINDTQLAVYTVPKEYGLAEICEIFETLNTTGTKVSTVDLVHSWLYSDSNQELDLREWIGEAGSEGGAAGWALRDSRPELIAQIVTACYLAEEDSSKPPPRTYGGKVHTVASVKAADLLATPSDHWRKMMSPDGTEFLRDALLDFQRLVAGGPFPAKNSPYPVSAAAYVALRWRMQRNEVDWSRPQLDSAYKAFFWRNALATRYDQGFLTQLGTDIKDLRTLLSVTAKKSDPVEWVEEVDKGLQKMIGSDLPDKETLSKWLTDGSIVGARRNALRLRMEALAEKDLLNREITLVYGRGADRDLHHIFPRAWCRDNKVDDLKVLLDQKEEFGHDWLNSPANLMPLSSESNRQWRASSPAAAIVAHELNYEENQVELEAAFIAEEAFSLLEDGPGPQSKNVGKFWELRAEAMAEDINDLKEVQPPASS